MRMRWILFRVLLRCSRVRIGESKVLLCVCGVWKFMGVCVGLNVKFGICMVFSLRTILICEFIVSLREDIC